MASPCRRACSTVVRMVCASPACPPQAMLTDVRNGISASCVPSSSMDCSSPTSELISIAYFPALLPKLLKHLRRRVLIQRLHRIGDDGNRLAIFQKPERRKAHTDLRHHAIHHIAIGAPFPQFHVQRRVAKTVQLLFLQDVLAKRSASRLVLA